MAAVMKDVVVLLPGLMGSVLEREGRTLWGLSAGAILRAVLSLGGSVRSLKLRGDDGGPHAPDGVRASALLPDTHLVPGLWKIDGYTRVADTLQSRFHLVKGQNYFEFPYDWRRDARFAAKRLAEEAPRWLHDWKYQHGGPADARLILIGHSLGGLVSRYFLEKLEGWKLTRALITFGTPYRGSLIALDKLVLGFRKRMGPLPLLELTDLVRSFESCYQLLPIYPCVALPDGKVVRPAEAAAQLGGMEVARAEAGLGFHREMMAAVERNQRDEAYRREGYKVYPVVGTFQPTWQGARLTEAGLQLLGTEPDGTSYGGDGTVPRVSALPPEWSTQDGAMFSPTSHAALQNAFEVLAHVEGVLSGQNLLLDKYRQWHGGQPVHLALHVQDAFAHDEPVVVWVRPSAKPSALTAFLQNVDTGQPVPVELTPSRGEEGQWEGTVGPLPPGVYRLVVKGGPEVVPAADLLAVFPATLELPFAQPPEGPKAPEPTRTTQGADKVAGAARGDEGTAVSRNPMLEPLGPARPGQPLALRVDLLMGHFDEATDATPVSFSGLAADWKQMPVEVRVVCAGLDFEPGADMGVVLVRRNQPSLAATLSGTVSPKASGELMVVATFHYNGRMCGAAQRRIPVEPAGTGTPGVGTPSPEQAPATGTGSFSTQGAVMVEADAQAPHLTVEIHRLERGNPRRLLWVLRVPVPCEGLPSRLSGEVDLGMDPGIFFRSMVKTAHKLQPGQHMAWFRGVGGRLYEQAPTVFRETYQALRKQYGAGFPIQFVTDEPHMPWELMRPVDVKDADLLALEHPVARWLLDYQTVMSSRLPVGDILTIAPDYTYHPQLPPLPQAQLEAKALVTRFQAQPVPGRRQRVLDVLMRGHARPVSLLHFAGHGSYSGDAVDPSRIHLEDGDLLTLEVRTSEVVLGWQSRPLVVFNACEVGGSSEVLGSMGGWAEAFVSERFSGFIAPMWPVQDGHARGAVEQLVEDVVDKGLPVGEALWKLRAREAETSPTFLSYVYVGDVLARRAPARQAARQPGQQVG